MLRLVGVPVAVSQLVGQVQVYASDIRLLLAKQAFGDVDERFLRLIGELADRRTVELDGCRGLPDALLLRCRKRDHLPQLLDGHILGTADERTDLADNLELRRRGMDSSKVLSTEIKGGMGQTHAKNRQAYNLAPRSSGTSQAVAVNEVGRPVRDTGVTSLGFVTKEAYEAGEKKVYASVRNVGQQTFYQRGRVWVTPKTSKLDLDKDKDKIRIIRRYSQQYFELARANTIEENQILASQAPDEELLVTFRSQVYLIQ